MSLDGAEPPRGIGYSSWTPFSPKECRKERPRCRCPGDYGRRVCGSDVNDDRGAGEFHEGRRLERLHNCGEVGDEERIQLCVRDVPGGDQQLLPWLASDGKRVHEVRILGDDNASIVVRSADDLSIRGAVALRQVQRVQRVVSRLLKPTREPARQLSIDEKLHDAACSMRFT